MFFEKIFDILDHIHQNRILYLIKKLDLETLIDVGSHKGEFLSFMLKNKNFKNFYAFEPQNNPYLILKRKNLKNSHVRIFKLAMSDKVNKKNFYIGKLTGTSTFEKLNKKSKYLNFKASKSLPFLTDTGGKIETDNGKPMRSPVVTQLSSTTFLKILFTN